MKYYSDRRWVITRIAALPILLGTTVLPENPGYTQVRSVAGTVESALFDIAEKRNIDILVDSTSLSPGPDMRGANDPAPANVPAPDPDKEHVTNVLVGLAQQERLSSRLVGEKTFLFWPEPDSDSLVRAIAGGAGYIQAQSASSDAALAAHLASVVAKVADRQGVVLPQQLAGRNGVTARNTTANNKVPRVVEFAFSDLPYELQSQIASSVVSGILSPGGRNFAELWLHDVTWQLASIYYLPPSPLNAQIPQALLAACFVNTPEGPYQLQLELNQGHATAKALKLRPEMEERDFGKRPEAGSLQLYSLARVKSPVLISDAGNPAGQALTSVRAAMAEMALPDDPGLAAPFSGRAVRIPLADFLAQAGKMTGVGMKLDPAFGADKLLISVSLKDMPARELMAALTRLYGIAWREDGAKAYSGAGSGRTAVEADITRLGFFPWYRFRDLNGPTWMKKLTDFPTLAAQVVDEAGPEIMKLPGARFSALTPELQNTVRARSQEGLVKNMLASQARVSDAFHGSWTFSFDTVTNRLTLLQDGKRIRYFTLRPLAGRVQDRPAAATPAR